MLGLQSRCATWRAMALSAALWLEKAEEARTIAAGLHDPEARRSMLEIAAGYVKLARHAALVAGLNEHAESDGSHPSPSSKPSSTEVDRRGV
jgi:hypothetical protein